MYRNTLNFRTFIEDDRGAVAVVFGMMLIVLLLTSGLAIDTSRYYNVSSRLQATLDEAALAGAKLLPDDSLTDSDIETATLAHFNQIVSRTGIAFANEGKLNVKVDRKGPAVVASMRVSVKSLFGPLGGLSPTVDIERSSRVTNEAKKIDLAMVLDVTGSMSRDNKLNDLKSAAKEAVDILFGNAATDSDVRIALAPYSASINAGPLASSVTSNAPTQWCTPAGPTGAAQCQQITNDADPCVVERQGANAATDAAPFGNNALPNVPSNEYYYSFDTTRNPYGRYSCPAAKVTPLRGRKEQTALKSSIDSFTADGGTAGQIGAAWGWYLISPEWKSVFSADSQPEDYDDNKVTKAIIFMTDGLFNTEYSSGPTPADATSVPKSYQMFQDICTAAKAKKIQIYTIYLGVNENEPRAIEALTQCASDAGSFFDASSGADLRAAFKSIVLSLNGLRVAS